MNRHPEPTHHLVQSRVVSLREGCLSLDRLPRLKCSTARIEQTAAAHEEQDLYHVPQRFERTERASGEPIRMKVISMREKENGIRYRVWIAA